MSNRSKAKEQTRECPTCHKKVVPDGGYCPNCGSPMDAAAAPVASAAAVKSGNGAVGSVTCPVCGMISDGKEEFCANCGAPLSQLLAQSGASVPAAATAAQAVKCSVCGTQIPQGEDYCPSCGAPRSASVALPQPAGAASAVAAEGPTVCPNCGAALKPGAKFCRECGERFTGVTLQRPEGDVTSDIEIGEVLAGRYRIASRVGGGGMGTVYKGFDLNLKTRQEPEGRQTAVKAILNTGDADLLAQAVEEREMLIRLDHPNIVRIFDIVQEKGVPYIVMAFVEGTSWKDIYDDNGGPLAESEALRLMLGIRGAFQYLHGRTPPVVYRDFKPGNVIQVDDNGEKRQVLIDLGTAMQYFPGQKSEAWGTVGFAPPEIGGICEQTPTMDLYSITSTLAALLGVDVNSQLVGVPPRREWPVSPEIYDFVERGRDPDPRVRFQSVTELFDQLEGIQRFIQGQERARIHGNSPMRTRSTNPLSGLLVPVQSTIITGRLSTNVTGKIGAFPALSNSDPAAQVLQPARDLMAAARYGEALTQIDAALKTFPASIDGHLLRAAALNNTGQINDARASLDQANRLSTPATRWRTLLMQAQAAEAVDDFKRAEQLYGELIKQVPGEVLPKQALADIYRQTGRYEPAADLYGRVVAADPANADAVLGWADSLVALNKTDSAIDVLDAVSENALRYVDAQLRLIELYLMRIDSFLKQQGNNIAKLAPTSANTQALLGDLNFAARSISGLNDKTESTNYYRLQADWWYAAYRLSKAGKLPANMEWPDHKPHNPGSPAAIGDACRNAYRRYLQRAPEASDREDVLARIYFDIEEWQ